MKHSIYARYIKRPMDIVLSLLALIVLCPVFLVIAISVRINLGSPIIFKQKRPGKKDKNGIEKVFTLYKFRTMNDKKDNNGELLPDELRLTNFGKFLRSTSLDELPELINILKGDMSIVGPRPLLVQYIPLYDEKQRHRHNVRPGLTGLAQINGRNAISWEDKFNYDIEYVNNITFFVDFIIIIYTVSKVFRRNGINNRQGQTMDLFRGTDTSKTITINKD